ncbi:MAG TPA: hypothetical protein VMV20_03130 [Chitinophagaceae bacterium]|nr:hypothetical protein [Chitinophagaceae bacterium]
MDSEKGRLYSNRIHPYVSKIPIGLVHSLRGLPQFEEEAFLRSHGETRPPVAIRFNPGKEGKVSNPFLDPDSAMAIALQEKDRISWCPGAYFLSRRPSFTLDPLFHGGVYYVQEPSSMVTSHVLRQVLDISRPLKVLDLCAAPGGKSTLIQSTLSPETILVSNEIIRSRVPVLAENLVRWGAINTLVTSRDPSRFQGLEGFFDVVVVDAPCSGSGLFRKDPRAVEQWSEQLVNLCAARQRRILSDILPMLKKGGILIYSTCSFSLAENEEIAGWLAADFGMEPQDLAVPSSWGMVTDMGRYPGVKGLRCYPQLGRGEGFFLTCLRNSSALASIRTQRKDPFRSNGKYADLVKNWISPGGSLVLVSEGKSLHAIPQSLKDPFFFLLEKLQPRHYGVRLGTPVRDEFLPDHGLALSLISHEGIAAIDLDLPTARKYLAKQAIALNSGKMGWTLIKYNGIALGWAKILSDRVNNYYPSSSRILQDLE